MEDEQRQRLKLRKVVKELDNYRARHTELITQYIPTGYNMQLVINQLSSEAGTARNIKSTTTRKNVIAALERMLQFLRGYKKTPERGLAVFSGNISEKEGQQDIRVWGVEPPDPIKLKLYKCDQIFHLHPLKEQMLSKTTYGIIVIDRREGDIAFLRGKNISITKSFKSAVPGKFKAGGQSAHRFERVIDNMAKDFFKKVGDAANESFSGTPVDGILLGGPGPTKEDFYNGNFLRTEIKKKVIAIKALGYTGDSGVKELVEKSADVLAKEDIIKEKIVFDKFMELLSTNPNIVAYGETDVKNKLEIGAVATLLILETFPDKEQEAFIERADALGGEIVIISKETHEGKQLKGLGGVAAILRFAIA